MLLNFPLNLHYLLKKCYLGNPRPPVFNNKVVHQSRDIYEISWLTISYQEMLEYRLLYRAVQVTEVYARPNNTILLALMSCVAGLGDGIFSPKCVLSFILKHLLTTPT